MNYLYFNEHQILVPQDNGPLDPEYENRVKAMYPEWREMQKTPSADMYLLIFSQCFRT